MCGLTEYTVVGAALGPASTVEMQAVCPSVPQVLCSHGCQDRSADVRHRDLPQSCTWICCGHRVSLDPSPASMCTCPLSMLDLPQLRNGVLQVLSLQRHLWHKSTKAAWQRAQISAQLPKLPGPWEWAQTSDMPLLGGNSPVLPPIPWSPELPQPELHGCEQAKKEMAMVGSCLSLLHMW